jgi:hypothetical protein
MDKDNMTADDSLGIAVLPLSSLLFAEDVDPFKGQWPPPLNSAQSSSNGATLPSYQPVPRAQALFYAPVILEGVHKGFLRGHVALQPEPVLSIEALWDARNLSLHLKHRT